MTGHRDDDIPAVASHVHLRQKPGPIADGEARMAEKIVMALAGG
jgi:hypothetical protein